MEKKHDLKPVRVIDVSYNRYEIPIRESVKMHECMNCGDLIAHEFLVTHYDLIGPCEQ